MSKNEGGDGIKGKDDEFVSKSGKLGGKKKVSEYDHWGCGEKWFDAELVKKRAEMSETGKLGVWESEKFVLWRQYSGKTFDELADLVPMQGIEESELYRYCSVYWLVLRKMTSNAHDWRVDDLGMLFLMKRMQDANEGSIFTRSMLEYYLSLSAKDGLRPKSHAITLTNGWVKRLRRKGLIEQIPGLKVFHGRKIAMFRISADGRRVLKAFVEAFADVSKDIRNWAKTQEDARYLKRYVARFTLGMTYEQVNEPDDFTFDEMVELTKRDLRSMGHRGTGHKPDYWKDLPD